MNKAKRLALEIPNAYYLNQNDNPHNAEAHYYTTGPEIWEQTQGKITHLICCFSTGGTISGTAKYLKEKNPNVKAIAVDSVGSVLKHVFETGKMPVIIKGGTMMEGVGKKVVAKNVNFSIIDKVITAEDKASAISLHELCNEEGIMMGYSSGATIEAVKMLKDELTENDTVVLIFPDHGCKYLDKVYDPEWMRAKGFTEYTDEQLNMITLVL